MFVQEFFKLRGTISPQVEHSPAYLKYANKKENAEVDNTFIGIEVEVEGVTRKSGIFKLPNNTLVWSNTTDNSLRNNGKEFVSIPLRGSEVGLALDKLYTAFGNDINCRNHTFSERTGLHVHVNMRDTTPSNVINFILLYILLEDCFYSFAGENRRDNIFCVPFNQSNKKQFVSSILNQENKIPAEESIFPLLNEWSKYLGFNILPLQTYGTIEFRHLEGTNNVRKIKTWIRLILALKKYSLSTSIDDTLKLVTTLNTSSEYLGLLQKVFGCLLDEIPLLEPEQALEKSVTLLKTMFQNQEKQKKYFYTGQTQKLLKENKLEPVGFWTFLQINGIIKHQQIVEKNRDESLA